MTRISVYSFLRLYQPASLHSPALQGLPLDSNHPWVPLRKLFSTTPFCFRREYLKI